MVFMSFTEEFCLTLEYYLSEALETSGDVMGRGFWCDGVLKPSEEQLAKKNVNDKRRIETTAFIGVDGQTRFDLIIYLGKYSLRRYARGTSLEDCLPNLGEEIPLVLDKESKRIELYML